MDKVIGVYEVLGFVVFVLKLVDICECERIRL